MLRGIEHIKNVGLFISSACTEDVAFGRHALIYGENGSGKSTISDILRSVYLNTPDIIIGRKTLGSDRDQEISLKFDTGRVAFRNGVWNDVQICPPVKIFDGLFVNDNVYSGDIVSIDHMKHQHKFILGREGVEYVLTLNKLYEENKLLNAEKKRIEVELQKALGDTSADIKKFLALPIIENIDLKIIDAQKRLDMAKKSQELKAAPSIKLLDVPSDSINLENSFNTTIKDISNAAVIAIKAHMSSHEVDGTVSEDGLDMETWLRHGAQFKSDISCPYCGQKITESNLVDAYSQYFSDNYMKLTHDLEKNRKINQSYFNGHFRTDTLDILRDNMEKFKYWNEAAGISIPDISEAEQAISEVEVAAKKMEELFREKSRNVVEAVGHNLIADAMEIWNRARKGIICINATLAKYNQEIEGVKKIQENFKQTDIENEIYILEATKVRYTDETIQRIEKISNIVNRKREIENETKNIREDLIRYSNNIVESLGEKINKYLNSLSAEFSIQYERTNFRGDEPATEYNIIINDVEVAPKQKGKSVDVPSFRNTLSAGDKSVLALSLFLAQCSNDSNLCETIVVFDDPFTSLDNFRMHVTAARISDICKKSKQAIVLSHDQEFLKILGEKLRVGDGAFFEVRYYESKGTLIDPYSIGNRVWPRNLEERAKIEEFVNGEEHDPAHIRSILRNVCENYYREVLPDTGINVGDKTLGQIVAALKDAPKNNPYYKFIEDLDDINRYSVVVHHGYRSNDPTQHTNLAELRNFCRKTLRATSGV